MSVRVAIRPEQIEVVARVPGSFLFAGARWTSVPWNILGGMCLYALREEDLVALMADAAQGGWVVLSGSVSERRGLRGFEVGLGAWGSRGKVECRPIQAWGLEPPVRQRGPDGALELLEEDVIAEAVVDAQVKLRGACGALNEEEVPFRASAYRWLGTVYDLVSAPLEPDGKASTLPADVASLCRKAHVGGPVVHSRTTLAPWVSLDRDRAYGVAMLEPMPCGAPGEVPLGGLGLERWRPRDLMRACGIVDATVRIDAGPFVPLLPLHAAGPRYDRARTIYPTGSFRGAWTAMELAALEEMGAGRVERIHRMVTFQARPVLEPSIRYLRRMEGVLPCPTKRLEHLLYGKCARGLGLTRIASAPSTRACLPRDLLDDRTLRRLDGRVVVRSHGLAGDDGKRLEFVHPLWAVSGRMSPAVERGTMDRPDRSAFVTSHNRVAMARLVRVLDEALKPARSGAFVGRIYVDGIDIEARPEDVPSVPGVSMRGHGETLQIYRAAMYAGRDARNRRFVEGGSVLPQARDEAALVAALRATPEAIGGPFAEGRLWRSVGDGTDPRFLSDERSEPLHVDADLVAQLGFSLDVLPAADERVGDLQASSLEPRASGV